MAFDAWFLWDLSDKIQNKSILVRHSKPAATKVGLRAPIGSVHGQAELSGFLNNRVIELLSWPTAIVWSGLLIL